MTTKPKLPTMKAAKSQMFSQYGYDPDTKTLAVRFANGGTYTYPGVTPEAFASMEGAESIGKHFAAHIRGNIKGVKFE